MGKGEDQRATNLKLHHMQDQQPRLTHEKQAGQVPAHTGHLIPPECSGWHHPAEPSFWTPVSLPAMATINRSLGCLGLPPSAGSLSRVILDLKGLILLVTEGE